MYSNLSQMHPGCAMVKIKRKIRGSSWPGLQRGRHSGKVLPHSRMKMDSSFISVGAALLCACFSNGLPAAAAAEAAGLRVLFLGDTGHHKPADRFKQLEPALRRHRIELDYTESLDDLGPAKLAGYDCLLRSEERRVG